MADERRRIEQRELAAVLDLGDIIGYDGERVSFSTLLYASELG